MIQCRVLGRGSQRLLQTTCNTLSSSSSSSSSIAADTVSISECECKRKKMDAFKAYKACAPIAWSPYLHITLVRGIPGTRRIHRRTLEALRLRKSNRTVMRWNTPTVRGMLQQIKRLIAVETEEMFQARKQKEAADRALRSPLVVSHSLIPPLNSS